MSEVDFNKFLKKISWVVVLIIFGAIVIPNFIRARTCSCQNACLNNLRLIDGAKQQWKLENRKNDSDIPTSSDLQPYLGRGTGQLPSCQDDPSHSFNNSYSLNAAKDPPTCKILPTKHILP